MSQEELDPNATPEDGETPDSETPDGNGEAAEEGGLLRMLISRPVTVIVGMILVVAAGLAAILDLPIQLTPDIAVPTITVNTIWPGASPLEVEADLVEEQEEVLKNVQGLTRMESEARLGQASVTLEFEVGTDLNEALVKVSNSLSQVPNYPATARQPVIATANSAGPPLAVIMIRSRNKGERVDAYRTWLEREILPDLERIKGIAEVRLRGGQDSEVHIDFDPTALAARGVTLAATSARVRDQLRNLSGGDITLGKRRLLMRTIVSPAQVEDFEGIVIGAGPDGAPIMLRDVARVREGLRKPDALVFANDAPAMALILQREAGTNVLEVTEDIKREVARLQQERFAPEGLIIEIVSEQSGYINGALELVQQNLLAGAVLAMIVLLISLRSLGASLIISVSIPICVFGTALGMLLFNRTVNVVSLAGVTFAIGMVVDNSIVALENIDTWRSRVSDPREAAYQGIKEVWGALLSSTATTAAVFIPIIVWQGEVGELLRDVAYAIAIAVVISLVVSVLVIPSLCARFLKTRVVSAEEQAAAEAGRTGWRRALDVRAHITRASSWLTASNWRSALVVTLALAGALGASWALLPKLEYLPGGNRNLAFGIMVPPPGISVPEIGAVGEAFTARVAPHVGVERDGVPALDRMFFVASPEQVFSGLVAKKDDEIEGALAFYRKELARVPGMIAFANQASLFGRSIGGGRSIEVELSGADLDETLRTSQRMFVLTQQQLQGSQIRPRPSLDEGAPELQAIPRRRENAPFALDGVGLGQIVDAYIDGAILGEYASPGERKVDVVIRAADRITGEELIQDAEQLRSSPVVLPTGEVVPFEQIATLQERLGPTVINRIERARAITLQINPPEALPLETAIAIIQRDVVDAMRAEGTLSDRVEVKIAGTAGELKVARERFTLILLIAFAISYLLLAALFEDFLAPLPVLITVPLAAAGGIAALRAVDAFVAPLQLDLMSALGFLILIGVVVNNAILVVDGALANMREGAVIHEAVTEAVRARVRPIFMSTTTSIVGLAPMVFVSGSGSELYRGVGAVVLGGLATSTLFTLFVVPCLFTLVWRARVAGKAPRELA